MTEQSSITLTDQGGPHVIVITPINITVPGGGLYATGQYKLEEGNVGIGLITIDENMTWTFDGLSDYNSSQLNTIANFIIDQDKPLLDTTPPPAEQVDTEEAKQGFDFTLLHHGALQQIHVLMHYPLYNIFINGKELAKLEQDHHSNWFVANGELDDDLVQQIGKKIVEEVVG